jgi:L-threonylcarbamoyladenylate synthase
VDVARAAATLAAGGLVAFPTETVYGLGADAASASSVRRVFAVKGRPPSHPLIVHVASPDEVLDGWSAGMEGPAGLLAAAFWPGPLTLLVGAGPRVHPTVTGGRATVGLRCPDHELARRLLALAGTAVAAPSANRFGRVSPTTAAHVVADLGTDVDLVLDGGPCRVGVESTIVDCTVSPPMVLRHGGVTAAALTTVLGRPVQEKPEGPSRAPGMLPSHYAPRCAVELVPDTSSGHARLADLAHAGVRARLLDPGPDAARYARHLYEWLREADAAGLDVVVVVPPPAGGLGDAVRDRLEKAAAPRSPDPATDDDP